MKPICRQIRQRAAEEGMERVHEMLEQTPAAARHVADCSGCQRALDALADLDAVLAEVEPIDASDDVVAALLAQVSAESPKVKPSKEHAWHVRVFEAMRLLRDWVTMPAVRRPLALAAVATFVLYLGLLIPSLQQAPESDRFLSQANAPLTQLADEVGVGAEVETQRNLASLGYLGSAENAEPSGGSLDGASSQSRARRSSRQAVRPNATAPAPSREDVAAPRDAPARSASPASPPAGANEPRASGSPGAESPVPGSPSKPASKPVAKAKAGAYAVNEKKDRELGSRLTRELRQLEADRVAEKEADLVLEEEITVTSEASRRDERALAKGATLSRTELGSIPTAPDPWAIVNETPGVLSDRINVGGNEPGQQAGFMAPKLGTDESAIAVDGVIITDLGAVGASPTYDSYDRLNRMQVGDAVSESKNKDASQPATPAVSPALKANSGGRRSGAAGARPKLPEPAEGGKKEGQELAQETVGFHALVEEDNARIEEMRLEAQRLEKELEALESGGASVRTSNARGVAATRAKTVAAAFLAERERVEPLTFQPATGYWANTYLPGDPARRSLEARLAQRGLDALSPYHRQSLRLHDAARQPTQPFDPPRSAALALYTDMDRHGAAGPARTLVQVGLRATDRHGGHRAPLALAVIVDLVADLSKEDVARVRALLRALLATVESGDRVHILFAGRDVPMLEPASFRHGAVMVAFEESLAAPKVAGRHGLAERLVTAQQRLLAAAATDPVDDGEAGMPTKDTSAALGAAGALIVSARRGFPEALVEGSHRSALAGVPVSVVSLGTRFDRSAYSRVALAGQGGLRHLIAVTDAQDLVDRELTSIGRVVARALRLNIRLAPGVQLVDVIGSYRLDRAATVRARAAEQRIDQMAQRDLGIRADRGEDDDGIQILIPAFYAGDAHVVLLDVVAPGPGKVADVSVRYKDLVRSKNGSAHARLKLGRATTQRQTTADRSIRSVRKSLLAAFLQAELERAADALATGRVADATRSLTAQRDLLTGLGAVDPGWASDRDLGNDLAVLHEYLAVLEAGAANGAPARDLLADSLRVAAVRKVLRLEDLRFDDLGFDDLGSDADAQPPNTKPQQR